MDSKEYILRKLINPLINYESSYSLKKDIETLIKWFLIDMGLGDLDIKYEYNNFYGIGDILDNVFEYDSFNNENTFNVNFAILSQKLITYDENATRKEIEEVYQFNALVLLKEILTAVNRVYVEHVDELTCKDETVSEIKNLQECYIKGERLYVKNPVINKALKIYDYQQISEHKKYDIKITNPIERYTNIKAYFEAINIYKKLITNEDVYNRFYEANKASLLEGYNIKNRLTYPLELYFSYFANIEGEYYLSDFKWYDKKYHEYMNTLSSVSTRYTLQDRIIYGMPIDNLEHIQLIRNKLK